MQFFHKGRRIKSVSLFGFGKSNRAVFEYLEKNFKNLKISIRLQKSTDGLPNGVRIFEKDNLFSELSEDLIFVSPSVRRDTEQFYGKLLSSDAELFFEKSVGDVFAVTGSDGKSTTTTIAKMLLGDKAYAIGNIGVPFTSAISYPKGSVFVSELSSFQLMDFAPKTKRAVITNISPNHLDWHKSMEEYVAAKENVLVNCGEPVFFIDDLVSKELYKKHRPFAIASLKLSEDEIKSYKAETYVYVKQGAIYADGKEILKLADISRKEDYNLKNFICAIALSYGYFEYGELSRIAKSFSGLPHRFELIYKINGTRFFNSSIDSSPQRTLSTLSQKTTPYVLLMGGRTKMKNYGILKDLIEKNAHALVLTGENRYEIYGAVAPLSVPIYIEEDFDTAVACAFDLALNNCDLIFSPASVSYDAFENFEKRGEAFASALERKIQDLKRKV